MRPDEPKPSPAASERLYNRRSRGEIVLDELYRHRGQTKRELSANTRIKYSLIGYCLHDPQTVLGIRGYRTGEDKRIIRYDLTKKERDKRNAIPPDPTRH